MMYKNFCANKIPLLLFFLSVGIVSARQAPAPQDSAALLDRLQSSLERLEQTNKEANEATKEARNVAENIEEAKNPEELEKVKTGWNKFIEDSQNKIKAFFAKIKEPSEVVFSFFGT